MSYQFGVSQLQGTTVPNAKYKTMLCRHYQATKQCAIGAKCQFAHGIQEQRQMNDPLPPSALSAMTTALEQPVNKPQQPIFQNSESRPQVVPCKYHAQNYCKNGASCQYMHDLEPQQQQLIQQPEDPMQRIFLHILIEMQAIFQQDVRLYSIQDIIQKIKIAYDQVLEGNLEQGSEQIKSIIHAPERTSDEIQKYTTLYNQAVTYYNQMVK